MMSSGDDYRLSFTTGGLFLSESVRLGQAFLDRGDWETIRAELIEEGQLNVRTRAASVRISREVVSRLQELSRDELEYLIDATIDEQRWLLWVATCRRYQIIREFAVEVMRERYLTMNYSVDLQDFDAFFNRKAQVHDEVENLKESTRRKLRQNLFRILREADLVNEGYMIISPVLTPRFVEFIAKAAPRDLEVFPASPTDLARWAS